VIERLNERIRVTLADGRNFQLRTSDLYDVITFEPPPPDHPGVVNLYSRDYYELCRDHLTRNGIICQWMPLKQFSDPTARMVVKTFVEVFPYSTLWEGSVDDYLIIGSKQPIPIRFHRFQKFAQKFDKQLEEIGLIDAYDLLASFKQGPLGLQRYAATGRIVTDNHPYLEYTSTVYPVVEQLRQTDLSELNSVVVDLKQEDMDRLQERVAALQSLQDYTSRGSADGDPTASALTQFHWARQVQRIYPHNLYVEDVLGCSPERLAVHRRRLGNRPETREDLAFALLLAYDYAAAEAEIRQLETRFPLRPLAYFLKGLLAQERGDKVLAGTCFQAGLQRVRNPDAFSGLIPQGR